MLRRIIRSWYIEEKHVLHVCGRQFRNTMVQLVPITVLLYDGPLLCGFNVAIKGLSPRGKGALRDVLLFVCLSPVKRVGRGVDA